MYAQEKFMHMYIKKICGRMDITSFFLLKPKLNMTQMSLENEVDQ